jgi:hypothetical protein
MWTSTIHGMMFGIPVIFFDRDTMRLGNANLPDFCITCFADTSAVLDTLLIVAHRNHSF